MGSPHSLPFRSHPSLSRFDPLPRIFYYDDFNQGMNGWTALIGNYEGSLDRMHPGYRSLTQPMLSNLTHWDGGTHGAMSGSYALKMATRPQSGAQGVAIKRVTFSRPCPIQLEFFFTFKPEASELRLSDLDVRSVGVLFDLQDDTHRVMPHLRYLNARDGRRVQRWQYKKQTVDFVRVGEKTVTHHHLADRDWRPLSDRGQELCYNEIPTKVNWHYVKVGFDLRSMRYTHFRCNGMAYDMDGIDPIVIPAMPNLRNMLNVAFFVETDVDKRAFYYVDSVILSGDWD